MKILLIEDDKLIGDGIHAGLRALGFTVDWFTDGQTGQQAIFESDYNAVILDLGLPNIDGLSILTFWRKKNQSTPVIILTARDAIEERVKGLQLGADDYLCKPFALAELVARLQALVRRHHGQSTPYLQHQQITLNQASRQVTLNEKPIALTAKEVTLLEHFLLNKNKVLSRDTLQNLLYSWQDDVSSNTVDVHIYNLRKKLGNAIIKTIYGAGYIMEAVNNEKA